MPATTSAKAQAILIIDDDPATRLLVRRVLEGGGFRVFEAESVNEGLDAARSKAPHLVLLDLVMPNQSGFDFLEIKNKDETLSHVPVIVQSGSLDRDSIYKATALGARDYVAKPLDAKVLLQKCRKVLHDRKFLKVTFDEGQDAKVQVKAKGKIVRANEVGLMLELPISIAPQSDVKLESRLLQDLHATDCHFRKSPRFAKSPETGVYLNEIAVIGISSEATQKIREVTKKWK